MQSKKLPLRGANARACGLFAGIRSNTKGLRPLVLPLLNRTFFHKAEFF